MVERSVDRVVGVDSCALTLLPDAVWAFAVENASAIAGYWRQRQAENPALFNGKILMCSGYELRDARIEAVFLRTDFANFLYWREHGYPDRTTFDAFGSALVRSADGAILLGRAAAHTINAGRVYLPGGFIDDRDVRADQSIDIEASIARELLEETGIDERLVARDPGFLVVFAGQLIALVAPLRSSKRYRDIEADAAAFIARHAEPELDLVVMVGDRAGLSGLPMPGYMQVLMRHLFAAKT